MTKEDVETFEPHIWQVNFQKVTLRTDISWCSDPGVSQQPMAQRVIKAWRSAPAVDVSRVPTVPGVANGLEFLQQVDSSEICQKCQLWGFKDRSRKGSILIPCSRGSATLVFPSSSDGCWSSLVGSAPPSSTAIESERLVQVLRYRNNVCPRNLELWSHKDCETDVKIAFSSWFSDGNSQ